MNKNEITQQYGVTGNVSGMYNLKSRTGIDDIELALDDALQTSPNIGVPAVLATYVDTEVTNVLFNPTRMTEVFPEKQTGDWTSSSAIFPVAEATGEVSAYGDYSSNGTANNNINYVTREQRRFQTNIRYGDFETELASTAKINLISQKQRAAATTVRLVQNAFYAYGVAGAEIYGYLNDPNKPTPIIATAGASGSTEWTDKDSTEIYEDIVDLIAELIELNPNISLDAPFILSIAPSSAVQMTKATAYNISAEEMLKKNYPKLRIVALPELQGDDLSDNIVELALAEIDGETVAFNSFGEKYRAGRVVPFTSHYEQKTAFSTYGCIIKHYDCLATMTGV